MPGKYCRFFTQQIYQYYIEQGSDSDGDGSDGDRKGTGGNLFVPSLRLSSLEVTKSCQSMPFKWIFLYCPCARRQNV